MNQPPEKRVTETRKLVSIRIDGAMNFSKLVVSDDPFLRVASTTKVVPRIDTQRPFERCQRKKEQRDTEQGLPTPITGHHHVKRGRGERQPKMEETLPEIPRAQ